MPVTTTHGRAINGSHETSTERSEANKTIAELITEAEEMRTIVLDAAARLTRLLSGLKQHRRQNRAVQASMHSLQQLRLNA